MGQVMAINLNAPVKLMRKVVNATKGHGGCSIVNVATKAGISRAVSGVTYTASKPGPMGATKNLEIS